MNNLPQVYDLFHPNPATLLEIAITKIAIELWRQEIRVHRANDTLENLDFEKTISSDTLDSHVPSSLLPTIDRYVKSIGLSIKRWRKFLTGYNKFIRIPVLRDFDDFVGDFDGGIHYTRTAERMLLCDEIDLVEKFKIACLYCLEDDIELLWPSVFPYFDLNTIQFRSYPELFYWICRLRNQLYKIPFYGNRERNYDEITFVLDIAYIKHWQSCVYFLSRARGSTERQFCLENMFSNYRVEFCRYLLAKMSERELDEFLRDHANVSSLMWSFWRRPSIKLHNQTAIWARVMPRLNVNQFVALFREVFDFQTESYSIEVKASACLEMWNCAPEHFKQSAIQQVLLDDSLFEISYHEIIDELPRLIPLLNTALSETSFENREIFWDKHWPDLIIGLNIDDFCSLMALCFENKEAGIRYRESVMSRLEKLDPRCSDLFAEGHLEKLKQVLDFCFADEKSKRNVRLRILRTNGSIVKKYMFEANEINKFINDAFDDIDAAAEFKYLLLSRPENAEQLKNCLISAIYQLNDVKEFIDTMLSAQHVTDFKKLVILPALGSYYRKENRSVYYERNNHFEFLKWCWENEDESAEFELKQIILIDEIVQFVIRSEMLQMHDNLAIIWNYYPQITYYPAFVKFLNWYFVTSEAYEEFRVKYADDDVFVKLTTSNT